MDYGWVQSRQIFSRNRLRARHMETEEKLAGGSQMPYRTDNTQAQQIPSAVIGYSSKLLGRTDVAKDTMAFQFEKPRNFLFRAGQSVDVTLLAPAQDSPDILTHAFSIASDPSDEEIMIPTRMRETAFKRSLSDLPLGPDGRL